MRKLLAFILVAACLYAGYWFVGARTVSGAMESWFEDRQTDGWVAEYADLSTRGFPSRFDTTLTDVTLADPATGLAYSAPFLQIFALSYQPNHIITVWPSEQSLASPLDTANITSEDMRASFKFQSGTSLAVETVNFEAKGLSVQTSTGTTAIGALQLAVRDKPTAVNTYDFYATSKEVTLDASLRRLLDPADLLPNKLGDMTVDMTASFDAPWDRFAIEDKRPQPQQIGIKLIDASWGDITLKATGDLDIAADGTPAGDVTVKVENWQKLLGLAESAGVLPGRMRPLAESMLGAVAGLSGNPNTIDAPLTFKNGYFSLGPLPLGRAPKIQLR